MRIPKDAPQPPPTTTTTLRTNYIDYKALLAEIPQIGDPSLHSPSVDTYPTTRDHPLFILPIAKPLIDLYQLGDDNTRTSQHDALHTIHQIFDSDQVTTDQIDKAAKLVVETIDGYHLLAQTIWPMDQPFTIETNTKLHPPITKSDTRQLKCITQLKNTVKRMLPIPKTNKPSTTDPNHTKQTQTQANEVLQLSDSSPNLENIPALCNKAIVTIIEYNI